MNYDEKFTKAIEHSFFTKLSTNNRLFIKDLAYTNHLTFQEIREYIAMARDLELWDEGELKDIYIQNSNKKIALKKTKELYIQTLDLLKNDIELIEYLANQLIDRWVLSKDEIFEEIQKYKDEIISQ